MRVPFTTTSSSAFVGGGVLQDGHSIRGILGYIPIVE
jgi:hypothetical protein